MLPIVQELSALYLAWVTYLRNHAKYSADNSWTMGSIYSAQ